MNIAATQFILPIHTYEIYLSGCTQKCPGCHNPQLWNFEYGTPFLKFIPELKSIFLGAKRMISVVRILGGEPLQQDKDDLIKLLEFCKFFGKELWLFTSYSLTQVPEEVMMFCTYVKCGRYDATQLKDHEEYGVKLASLNQHIFKRGVDF